jgi:putative FmdB family regulatory protein
VPQVPLYQRFAYNSRAADTIEEEFSFPEESRALPLYAYRCTQCGHRLEKIQHFNSEPERVCPKCNGVLERPLTAPGLHFKGAGFYVNDYAGQSSVPAGTSTAAAAAPAESKPAACAGDCAACPAAAATTSAS